MFQWRTYSSLTLFCLSRFTFSRQCLSGSAVYCHADPRIICDSFSFSFSGILTVFPADRSLLGPRLSRLWSLHLQEQVAHLLHMIHQACRWGHCYFCPRFPSPCILPTLNTAPYLRHWLMTSSTSWKVVPHLPLVPGGTSRRHVLLTQQRLDGVVYAKTRHSKVICPLPHLIFN